MKAKGGKEREEMEREERNGTRMGEGR